MEDRFVIVVNADDWALEPIRDKAIAECFRRGWVTQTTAVMNCPGLESATELARREGFFDCVGLHINLVYGRPLTSKILKFPEFCNQDGMFNARFHRSLSGRLWLPKQIRDAVEEEVRAQVQLYKRMGYSLMRADSHQHTHNDISITPLIVRILKDEGFRSLRLARNMGVEGTFAKRLYKWLLNGYIRYSGLACSDYFGSVEDFRRVHTSIHRDATIELMCHPMYTVGLVDREDGELTDFYEPFDVTLMDEIARKGRS